MPTTVRPYEPNQTLLLPPDLRDWLPPDHLAYDIADLVDALHLAPFYAPFEGDGRRNCPLYVASPADRPWGSTGPGQTDCP